MPVLFWLAPSFAPTLVEGWGIVVFYICMGLGWPWYDVVVRAVALDNFPKEQSPYAFASLNMFSFGMQAMYFFLGNSLSHSQTALMLFILALCIVPGYLLAKQLQKNRPRADSDDSKNDD